MNEYHFVITINAIVNGRGMWESYTGVIPWDGNRHEAFNDRLEYAANLLGCRPNEAEIICWSFERNQLP